MTKPSPPPDGDIHGQGAAIKLGLTNKCLGQYSSAQLAELAPEWFNDGNKRVLLKLWLKYAKRWYDRSAFWWESIWKGSRTVQGGSSNSEILWEAFVQISWWAPLWATQDWGPLIWIQTLYNVLFLAGSKMCSIFVPANRHCVNR